MKMQLFTPRTRGPLSKAVAAVGMVAVMGVVGAGCLTRPVAKNEPTTKTNFTAVVRQAAVDKVDILFAIDNSASMGDKQLLLAQAVPDLLGRLLTPNCVDDNGNPIKSGTAILTTSDPDGKCTQGKAEFKPVHDLHIGIVTSSLGGRGSDVCDGTDPVGAGSTRHDNDDGKLIARGSDLTGTAINPAEHAVPDMGPSSYLAWLPDVAANANKDPSIVAAGATPLKGDPAKLISDFQESVAGVHEFGCGLEGQLESWYRFLVQPDPYGSIDPDPAASGRRVLNGVNADILKQRHDFLRPDSLVAIVMLTDEDDSVSDPRGVGGQGWAYMNKRFPGSVGGGAARGTSACDNVATVNTAACTSCGFPGHASDPNCQKPGDVDSSTNQPQLGYYTQKEDTLNTRFFHMKQRYGVDPQFTVARYTNGLKSYQVPDRNGEAYDGTGTDGQPNSTYKGRNNCTNPLFAAYPLPTDPSTQDLCKLARGPRSPDLVFFALIGGVPWQLLTENPSDPNAKFKASLTRDDWKKLVGNDPANYDYTGQDIHMVQSITPRAGLPAPDTTLGSDPYNGREWETQGIDLQYACTFQLPAQKDCKDPKFTGACDCTSASPPQPPLCNGTTQVRGKAYPTVRQLTVVRDLAEQGIVASLCPRSLDTNSEDYGYRPAVRAIVDRLKNALANQCLPQKLTPGACGDVPCLILETLGVPGPEEDCLKYPGLGIPDPVVLAKFRDQQRADQGTVKGDAGPGFVDQTTLPVCQVTQLVGNGSFPSSCTDPHFKYTDLANGSCATSGEAGWCYVSGTAAGAACAQAILFSPTGNPQVGSRITLQCIEASGGGAAGTDAGP